jgi:hypothetical protein
VGLRTDVYLVTGMRSSVVDGEGGQHGVMLQAPREKKVKVPFEVSACTLLGMKLLGLQRSS